jgi:hypothetical protein
MLPVGVERSFLADAVGMFVDPSWQVVNRGSEVRCSLVFFAMAFDKQTNCATD